MSKYEPKDIENYKNPLNTIYFYLTEGCNLCCRHCWVDPKHQLGDQSYSMLGFQLFESALLQAKPLGLSGVKLTGGEPLLHPQILQILELIRQEELKLTIETNGLLCTADIAQSVAACKNAFVSVSLDGTDAETHEWVRGVVGCFEGALNGIRNLVNAGLRPQIIMSIMRHNVNQMENMVDLAESLGAGSVKFNIVQATARGEKMYQAGETLTIDELVGLGRWVESILSTVKNLRIHYSHPLAFRPLRKMLGGNSNGCGSCGILGIIGVLANGFYALCGIGKTIPELAFGHIETDKLEDIWNNNPILLELRNGLPNRFEGVCRECLLKERCNGYCVAQNYYQHKNFWAPFWYCQNAKKKNLFPISRIKILTKQNIAVLDE